ncbi:MAG: hypothetical protein KGL39_00885 [Patescibacteria group bacterium]|nr:hypothetical protein [Patescibacteria group bacterium]
MRIFLDLDGVLVDFVGGACQFHGVNNPYELASNHGKYDLCALLNMEPSRFWGNLGFDFWKNLDWMPDGKGIFQIIEKHFGKDNIVLCTSPCETLGCVDGKREWIKEHLPDYYKSTIFTQVKKNLALPGTLLIDDSDNNVRDFEYQSCDESYGLLVPRLWNSQFACAKDSTNHVLERINWFD